MTHTLQVLTPTPPSPTSQKRYVGRLKPFRFPRSARRHTKSQLKMIAASPALYPHVLVDDDGLVVAGFAVAQLEGLSWRGRRMTVVKLSSVNRAYIDDYVRWMKSIAFRHNWDDEMLATELQYLQAQQQ